MIARPRLSAHIQNVKLVNERLMKITVKLKDGKDNFYKIYTPHHCRTKEEQIEFLNTLGKKKHDSRQKHLTIVMVDFNGRVRKERRWIESIIDPFGEQYKNEEGERLTDFCVRNDLKILTGFLKYRGKRMYTTYRWKNNTEQLYQMSAINYITSDKRIQKMWVLPEKKNPKSCKSWNGGGRERKIASRQHRQFSRR